MNAPDHFESYSVRGRCDFKGCRSKATKVMVLVEWGTQEVSVSVGCRLHARAWVTVFKDGQRREMDS